jgi:hypothetical protein
MFELIKKELIEKESIDKNDIIIFILMLLIAYYIWKKNYPGKIIIN